MAHAVLSPYVAHPPVAKVLDCLGRAFSYAAMTLIGVTTLLPGTVLNDHLTPGPVYKLLAVVLVVSSMVAMFGVMLNSFFTEALSIGFVFLGFTPFLISAASDLSLDLDTLMSLILAATILTRWNYLNSAISQARRLKEFTDAGISEVA